MNTTKKVSKKTTVKKGTDIALAPIENVGIELFTEEGLLETTLDNIKTQALSIVYVDDVTTEQGRKDRKAVAYIVARSKTTIEAFGKDHVADLKAKAKVFDDMRKLSREYLGDVQTTILEPVKEYLEEQERRAAAAAEKAQDEADEVEAYDMHDLWLREEKVRLAQEEINEAQRIIEREKRDQEVREEAVEAERLRNEEKLRQEKLRRENAENEQKAAGERANLERERQEKLAIHDREEAITKERERIEREQLEKEEAERLASEDKEHQQTVNRGALESLIEWGVEEENAKIVLRLIIADRIPQIKMAY